MSKHILIFSHIFHPEEFRINDIAIELVSKGYKVSVIAGTPNYPKGKVFPGYKWYKFKKEIWEGIDIYRIPMVPRGSTKLQLILNYISFVISGYIFQYLYPKDVDIVMTYEGSPITQALPAIWYANKLNINHSIYVLDLWPDNVSAITGINNRLIITPLNRMVDYIYDQSKLIHVSSESFAVSIANRNVPKAKIIYWPQFAEDFYEVKNKESNVVKTPDFKERTFVFAGNIGQGQGLEILPQVASKLSNKNKKAKFIIIGDGRAKKSLLDLINRLKVNDYFYFIDKQPPEKIPYFLAKFDVGLITLNSNPIFEKTIPAKVQSLMACGMPILASADGEVQDIIKKSGSGLSSDAGNIQGLYKNICKYIDYPERKLKLLGENSLEYSKNNFNKELLMNELMESLERNI